MSKVSTAISEFPIPALCLVDQSCMEIRSDAMLEIEDKEVLPVSGILGLPKKKNWTLAVVVLLALTASSVTESQLLAVAFEPTDWNGTTNRTTMDESPHGYPHEFRAPFFHTLLRFTFRSLPFPIVCLVRWTFATIRGQNFSLVEFFRHCAGVTGAEGFTFRIFLSYYSLPALAVICTGILYIVALIYVAPSVTAAFFSAMVAISYILSMLFLDQSHLILKSFFVIVSFVGVALVGYATTKDPLQTNAYIGVLAVLGSCFCLSAHQVLYTKSFPNADSNQAAFTVTVFFAVGVLFYWPVPLILKLTGAEEWHWTTVPWDYLLGSCCATLALGFLYALCLTVSSPFFVSLGELLNLAISGVCDYFFRSVPPSSLQVLGSVIIGLAFVILILPDERLSIDVRSRLRRKKPLQIEQGVNEVSMEDAETKAGTVSTVMPGLPSMDSQVCLVNDEADH